MASVDYIQIDDTFTQKAIDNSLWQFKDSSIMNGIIDVLCNRYSYLQKPLYDISNDRLLDNAYGVLLDEIGISLKVLRNAGEIDNAYRNRIKIAILNASSSGTRDEVVHLLTRQSATNSVNISHTGDKFLSITAFQQCLGDTSNVTSIINSLPLNTFARMTSKGGGFVLGFKDSGRNDVKGLRAQGIPVENNNCYNFIDTSCYSVIGDTINTSLAGNLSFNSITSDTDVSISDIPDGEYTAIINVSSITNGGISIVHEDGNQPLSVGVNVKPVSIIGGNLSIHAPSTTVAVITEVSVLTYIQTSEQVGGRFSGLIYQTGGFNDSNIK